MSSAVRSARWRDMVGQRVLALAGAGVFAALAQLTGATLYSTLIMAALAGLMMPIGYRLGSNERRSSDLLRLQMERAAEELTQYRAFTRFLRDQGGRITASTAKAAEVIVNGLRHMDDDLEKLRILVDTSPQLERETLLPLLNHLNAPVITMLGQLQFQDVTQQQITFLTRLSVIVDEHMTELAAQLRDNKADIQLGKFREMFNRAVNECVMDSQRIDHGAALGLDLELNQGPEIELF